MFEDVRNFVKYNDLRWSGILKSIKKSPNLLQPLFEVFTNSLEAIKLRQRAGERFTPYINVSLIFRANLFGERDIIQEISVEDNGIGFNDESYSRLVVFKDDTKGFNNRGSGRIQMIHFFRQVKFDSVYHEGASLMKRRFVLSKEENFLRKNTILYKMEEPSPVQGQEVRTIVRMTSPMEEKDAKEYAHWSSSEIKEQLIKHYLLHFCNIKNS